MLSTETLRLCWSSFVRLAKERELPMRKISRIERRVAEVIAAMKSSGNGNHAETPGVLLSTSLIIPESESRDKDDAITFEEVMGGLCRFAASTGAISCDTTELFLREVWDEKYWKETMGEFSTSADLDAKLEKHNRRYDEMIEQFTEWKEFIPPNGEGRRLDILRGCFVGSENEAVVEALRVIYVDHAALRLSGDWIFKVVATIMNRVVRTKVGS